MAVGPAGASGLLADRGRDQAGVLADIRQRFGDRGLLEVPLLGGQLTTPEELGDVSAVLDQYGW